MVTQNNVEFQIAYSMSQPALTPTSRLYATIGLVMILFGSKGMLGQPYEAHDLKSENKQRRHSTI